MQLKRILTILLSLLIAMVLLLCISACSVNNNINYIITTKNTSDTSNTIPSESSNQNAINSDNKNDSTLYIAEFDFSSTQLTEYANNAPNSFVTEFNLQEKRIIVKAEDFPNVYYDDLKKAVTNTLKNDRDSIVVEGIKIENIEDYTILIETENGDLIPVPWENT